MELSEKIKEIRKKFNLTQEQFAEKLNVSRQAIAKWESGLGIPDIGNLKELSKLTGISIDTLLNNNSNNPIYKLHKEINLKDYGKGITEQHKNLLNKNFDEEWEIYILNVDDKFLSTETFVDFLTNGLSSVTNVIKAFKETNYLAINDNCKLLVTISKTSIDIKNLNSNINIKKFEFENKIYYQFAKMDRF